MPTWSFFTVKGLRRPAVRKSVLLVLLLLPSVFGCATERFTPVGVVPIPSRPATMPACHSIPTDPDALQGLESEHDRTLGVKVWHQIPQPTYPPIALQHGWQGEVLICMVILRDGTVNRIKLLGSSGIPLLDSYTLGLMQSIKHLDLGAIADRAEYMIVVPFRYHLPDLTHHQRLIAADIWARLMIQQSREHAIDSSQSGTTILRVTLTAAGDVGSIHVDQSSGSELIDEAGKKLIAGTVPFPSYSADRDSPFIFVIPIMYNPY